MKYFERETGVKIPKVNHDFMKKYKTRILKAFACLKDGDSTVLPFSPCTVYPILNRHGVEVKVRQLALCSWRYWIIYKERVVGETITILECEHNRVNRGDKGVIKSINNSSYEVDIATDEGLFTTCVDIDKVI